MNCKYRVKGIVNKPFILRGAYFAITDNMDFYIYENELGFVKSRCELKDIIDLQAKPVSTPEPMLEETKTESKPKGVKNGQKSNSASKAKHKENLQLA